jgi:hypothetical protein
MAYFNIVLSALVVLIYASCAQGSGGGISNVGCVSTGATSTLAARQWVTLDRTGHFLVGRTGEGVVDSIVIHAAGTESSNVILREIAFPDGGTSVFVSGPADLGAGVQEVYLYVRGNPATSRLLEYRNGQWKEHSPTLAPLDPDHDSRPDESDEFLLEFRVSGLGQYHLHGIPASSPPPIAPVLPLVTAHGLVGGGVACGLWHLGLAVLLLALASMASRCAHAIQARRC